jgi:hypothetical protein
MEVIQINLNHCEAAQDLLWQTITESRCDVVVIADPYRVPKNDNRWVTDKTGKAAILVCGRFPIQEVISNNEEGFVVARVNDVYICGCYAPPRLSLIEYEEMLDSLTSLLVNKSPVIIAGDLNAWSLEWGSRETNQRGQSTLLAMAQLDVVVANQGNEYTFISGLGRGSVVDITFCSPILLPNLKWRVGKEYTASDHQYVFYTVGSERCQVPTRSIRRGVQWKEKEMKAEVLCETFDFLMQGRERVTPNDLRKVMIGACDMAMPRRIFPRHRKGPVYWWTDEIAQLRSDSNKARRRFQRGRTDSEREARLITYKKAKTKLNIAIKSSKRQKFKELCQAVDDNPWGFGYRMVMAKLRGPMVPRETCPKKLKEAVSVLFPQHDKVIWSDEGVTPTMTTEKEITNLELIEAAQRLKRNKAPGPDGIPNLALRILVMKFPNVFREVLQGCMTSFSFPNIWKRQRLVLIPKPGKASSDPSSFRPIGLLDGLGKLLERVIQNRLMEYTEKEGGLSKYQFGFRRKRSTVDAISKVTATAGLAIKNSTNHGRYCTLVTIDVKNAFNSASWKAIVRATESLGASSQLLGMIKSYLSSRALLYDTEEGQKEMELTAGVPQGSIVGPILWNIMYDAVLKLKMPDGVKIIGFADDLILLVTTDTIEEAEYKVEVAVEAVQRWMESNELMVAHQKTEIVVVSNRRIPVTITPMIGGFPIKSERSMKYLGVMTDDRLNFSRHVDYACKKASKVHTELARLMPNKFGARNDKRRMLANVVTSILRYGGETWIKAVDMESNRRKLNGVHRLAVTRVISAYRTVSYDAACVLAGMMPICMTLKEDKKCGESRKRTGGSERNIHREQSLVEWQEAWDRSTKGRWTYRLIPRIRPWLERKHGEVDYYLTQFMTGHGAFNTYLHKIKKVESPRCPMCTNEDETPEHVVFSCPRFDEERVEMMSERSNVNVDNVIELMSAHEGYWKTALAAITKILTRLDDERVT